MVGERGMEAGREGAPAEKEVSAKARRPKGVQGLGNKEAGSVGQSSEGAQVNCGSPGFPEEGDGTGSQNTAALGRS